MAKSSTPPIRKIRHGNKRTGANAAITVLLLNQWDLDMAEDELVELVLNVAFKSHARPAALPT